MINDSRKIKIKAMLGLGWLTLILGLAMFIPAGTFDFWQAWVWLIIFSGSAFLNTLFLMKKDMELLKRRLYAGGAAEKEKNQKIIQSFARYIFIAIILLPGYDRRFGCSHVPIYLVIAGDVFVALGFYIVFLVFRENSFTSALIEIAENQTVVSTGPYALVRHPMYSGALLMLLFTPFALGSFWALIPVILMFVVIIFRLLDEEKFLSKSLPGYRDYCERTAYRLIPFVW
jgi:protein-S-isoprenylcysteine O-methyltransferase Ste14